MKAYRSHERPNCSDDTQRAPNSSRATRRSISSATRCGSNTASRRTRSKRTGAISAVRRLACRRRATASIDTDHRSRLNGYRRRVSSDKATSANRRLSVFRRYYAWARARASHGRRSHVEAALGKTAAALSQDAQRSAGRSAAACARHRDVARPARPHDARTDVRERPARDRTGHAEDGRDQPERRRLARDGQGLEGAPDPVRRRRRMAGSSGICASRARRCSARAPPMRSSSPHAARA